MIAKGAVMGSGVADLTDSEAEYVKSQKTSEAANSLSVTACKTRFL